MRGWGVPRGDSNRLRVALDNLRVQRLAKQGQDDSRETSGNGGGSLPLQPKTFAFPTADALHVAPTSK